MQNMRLIPQTMTMSCWYASAQMLIQWRRKSRLMTEAAMPDPSEDPVSARLRDDNSGIVNPQIVETAKRLGLVAVPPMSPSPNAIYFWLRRYGPLWVNGKSHIVVLAGISDLDVLVYDPSPVNEGRIDWRSLSTWYTGDDVDSRDTGPDVRAVLLHCPA